MKKTILFVLVTTCLTLYGQNQDSIYARLSSTMAQLGRTRSQFSNVPYNFVSPRLQEYMNNSMNMYVLSDEIKDNKMHLVFEEKVSFSGPPKKLEFNFNLYTVGSFFYIKDCKITGHRDKVVSFYIDFWRQDLQVDEKKPGEFKTMCLQDDAVLHYKPKPSQVSVDVFARN